MKRLAPAALVIAMVLGSCGLPDSAVVYPGRTDPLGHVTIPAIWHKVPIANGGRTANLYIPKRLGLETAENETRPAISLDLIGNPDGSFNGPFDQEYWIRRHIAEVQHHEAPDLQSLKLRSVENPQIGPIGVYRLQGDSWGDSLMAVVVGSHGWYLAELRADNSESIVRYEDDFVSFLESVVTRLA